MASGETVSRDELVTALRDVLTLISLELLPDGAPLPGLPGTWSPRPDGHPGARVTLASGEQILVEGVATTGVVDIDAADPHLPGSGSVALDDEHGILVWLFEDAGPGENWVGLTAESAPRMRSFRGIASYPADDHWRVPVTFTPATANERVSTIRRYDGNEQHGMHRAGWFTVTIDGQQYRLSVEGRPGHAYVTFRDAGSGTESYGAGRVIRLPGEPAEVEVLDFNQATVLPCALNQLVNCPLPASSNVIRTEVRAGQRDVLFDVAA